MTRAIRTVGAAGAMLAISAVLLIAQGGAGADAAKGKGGGKAGSGKAAKQKQPSRPTPRWPDGHPMLGPPPGEIGYWNSGTGGLVGRGGNSLPTNMETADEI